MSEPQRYNLEPFATDALVPDEEGDFVLWADVVSRLSHDRGADAEWEALIIELDAPQPGMTSWGSVQRHRPLIEAALSVPAPALPALDAASLAQVLADHRLPTGEYAYLVTDSGKDHLADPSEFAAVIVEALRDAV